ncbi:MAG TPA: hypothetical protein VIF09_21255 [Polyangiaceae bacterium]
MTAAPRFTALAALGLAALAAIPLSATTAGCKRSKHARVTSFTPPPLPAGFAEQSGAGWRIAVPSTWKDAAQRGPAAWAVADPQAVDDFHANVNVVTEPFTIESYEYAHANEAALRREPRCSVEVTRDDVVDGDPTLIVESRWSPTPPSTVAYRTMQTFLSSRGTGYVVTCSVSSSAFERYRSTCESIVRSFAVER